MLSESPEQPAIPPSWFAPAALPLEVDFGCHRGAFLLAMAATDGTRNFLGIERQSARVDTCNKRIRRRELPNAFAVRGEGAQALRELLPDASVHILHVSFPDPWPKRRHEGRRLVKEDFLLEAARVLRPDGILRLMTDDAAYFAEMVALTKSGWSEVAWDDGIARPMTTFEMTFRKLGKVPFQRALSFPESNPAIARHQSV